MIAWISLLRSVKMPHKTIPTYAYRNVLEVSLQVLENKQDDAADN